MKIRMFAPQDLESGDRFLTSPFSGDTYRLRDGISPDLAARLGLWLDGVRRWSAESIDPLVGACDYVPTSSAIPAIDQRHLDRIERIWDLVSIAVGKKSLRWIAKRVAIRGEQVQDVAAADVLHLAHALRRKTRTNCLPHSFWQAGLLSYFGLPSTLHVGLWLPTKEAHAWVMAPTTDNPHVPCVIGDSMDFVMHYAPTISIEFGRTTREALGDQDHSAT